MSNPHFPQAGLASDAVLDALRTAKSGDVDWRGGRTNMYVQFGGDAVLEVARQASALYYSENAHGTAAFPSVARLQADVLDWLLGLVGASPLADGCLTASGSESIMLSLKAARDWSRGRRRGCFTPQFIVPQSAHPAFEKAAGFLDLEIVRTPLRGDSRADVDAMAARIGPRTIGLAGSAPQFGHGVIDPVTDIAQLACRHNLWLHVDACIGALIAPFARAVGAVLPAFDFTVEGVRSISADIHKYGFGAKGASAALFRHSCWRPSYVFDFDDWPIGSYSSGGIAGTRPAGPIAAAWAVMRYLGHEGYCGIVGDILAASERLQTGLAAIDGVVVVGRPDLPVIAWQTPDLAIREVVAGMVRRGWFVRTMARPPAVHMGMITMQQVPVVDDYLAAVRDSVAEARTGHRKETHP